MSAHAVPPGTPVVPLQQRLRADTGAPRALWSSAPAPTPRQAFAPPDAAPRLERPIEEHPEFQRRVQAALAQAEADGLARAQEQVEEARTRYAAAIARVEETIAQARRPRAPELADLALTLTRALIGREVSIDATFLARAIADVLDGEHALGDSPLSLRLNPADADHVLARAPALAARARVVRDARLGAGDFVLENAERVIDGTIEARLQALRLHLVAALEKTPAALQATLEPTPEPDPEDTR